VYAFAGYNSAPKLKFEQKSEILSKKRMILQKNDGVFYGSWIKDFRQKQLPKIHKIGI
jgi:hypothetical protein